MSRARTFLIECAAASLLLIASTASTDGGVVQWDLNGSLSPTVGGSDLVPEATAPAPAPSVDFTTETIGLEDGQVDPGDHLLDWRHGGRGLRYVHAFESSELEELAGRAGFRRVRTYHADGQGGRLGRYEVWSVA